MRKPFLLFFLLISIICWFSDLINFLFYVVGSSSTSTRLYCWIISFILTGALFFIYKKFSKKYSLPTVRSIFAGNERSEWGILLLVSSPVILLGLFRALYPDTNYDQFHYELYLQEYDLSDNVKNFAAGSLRSYFFPLTERISVLFRYAMWYRMGTIVNTFILVTIILSVYDFVKKIYVNYLPEKVFPRVAVALFSLFAVFADNTLFTSGSYKTDLFGVPIVLELIHLYFFPLKNASNTFRHRLFFFLGSISLAYKLTFLPYTAIITIFYIIRNRKDFKGKDYLVNGLILISFPLIYVLYSLIETGNPIFPFYNDIFRSKYFELKRFRDERYGIYKLHELFTFHFVTLKDKERISEWHIYSWRLLIGYLSCIVVIISYLIKGRAKGTTPFFRLISQIALLAILFDYGCVITSGYFRYGAIVEILYGVVLAMLFFYLFNRAIAVILFLAMTFQAFTTFRNIYIVNFNLSWHDYNALLSDWKGIKKNSKKLFHDYGKITDSRGALKKAQAFVNIPFYPQDGLAKYLNGDIPIYDLQPRARREELTAKKTEELRNLSGKQTLLSVCSMEPFNIDKFKAFNQLGFMVTNLYEVYPDFLKEGEPVFLMEVKAFDTATYSINAIEQYLRDENAPELRNGFEYNTGNNLKVFVREAPFAYFWDFLPAEYDITINGVKHSTKDRFGTDRIMTIDDNKLKIEKPNGVPYLVIIQELVKKQ
jgi:hypothetical protein